MRSVLNVHQMSQSDELSLPSYHFQAQGSSSSSSMVSGGGSGKGSSVPVRFFKNTDWKHSHPKIKHTAFHRFWAHIDPITILLRTKRQSGPVGSDNKPVYELEKEGIYLLVVHVAAVRKTHPVNNDNATTITTTTTTKTTTTTTMTRTTTTTTTGEEHPAGHCQRPRRDPSSNGGIPLCHRLATPAFLWGKFLHG